MLKFAIYKVSEWSGEAEYFVRFTERGTRFYSTLGDAMIMSDEEADKLIAQGVAKYKYPITE